MSSVEFKHVPKTLVVKSENVFDVWLLKKFSNLLSFLVFLNTVLLALLDEVLHVSFDL